MIIIFRKHSPAPCAANCLEVCEKASSWARELSIVLSGFENSSSSSPAVPVRFHPVPEQPIFYPVLNRDYAAQIASDWNPFDSGSGNSGFVTEFDVDEGYLQQFEVRVVGGARHQELWVPADKLTEFNSQLRSPIRATSGFYGPGYLGPVPLPLIIRKQAPTAQLKVLSATLSASAFDFGVELAANWKVVVLNHGFWSACPPEEQGLSVEDCARTLAAVSKVWELQHRSLPLPRGTLVKGRT